MKNQHQGSCTIINSTSIFIVDKFKKKKEKGKRLTNGYSLISEIEENDRKKKVNKI